MASARRVLAMTGIAGTGISKESYNGVALVNYVNGRQAFGGFLGDLQTVQHRLAQLRVDVQVCL